MVPCVARGMRSVNNGVVLFNLGGGVLLLTLVGYMGYSGLHSSGIKPCSERYPAGLRYSFTDSRGTPLSPVELQARSGLDAWGILENAKIEHSADAPTGTSLLVSLASSKDQEDSERSGVGFVWQPNQILKAGSACLSYSVNFPSNFDFGHPGYLPGLVSTSSASAIEPTKLYDGFAARVAWLNGTTAGIEVRTPGDESYWQGSGGDFLWPTGRWVKIEQEIGLSRTGAKTGILRMWIDGELRVQNDEAPINRNQLAGFTGIAINIGYVKPTASTASVRVSPFVVQRQ